LKKIDSALARIDDGNYGYCEETGDEIGLRRLEARPVATLCVEAQERRELAERQFRDREDQYR
jgi:DnaK suppressor protein